MRLGLIIVSITGTFFLIQFVYYARGHRGEDPPDPIPNSEVKLPIADDTACWWESRSLRAFFLPISSARDSSGFFLLLEGVFPRVRFPLDAQGKNLPLRRARIAYSASKTVF